MIPIYYYLNEEPINLSSKTMIQFY